MEIKSVEKISFPQLEIASHRIKLRKILLSRYAEERKRWLFFNIFQKFSLAGLGVILIFFVFNNLIYPNYTLAKAKEIALKDPQIKELIEKGGKIKDIEIIKNQAYFLIQPPREEIAKMLPIKEDKILESEEKEEIKREESYTTLAEINIKEKKVTKLQNIVSKFTPLTEEEKEEIQEISWKSPKIQKEIPKEAEIKEIIIPPAEVKLAKKGKEIQILSEKKNEAIIIYQLGKNHWKGKVNLKKKMVEDLEFLNATDEEKKR